jgi:hypothetical protein
MNINLSTLLAIKVTDFFASSVTPTKTSIGEKAAILPKYQIFSSNLGSGRYFKSEKLDK